MTDRPLVPCPTCRKPSAFDRTNKFRPFCSERCQLIDLGEWFNEERRIQGVPAPDTLGDSES